MAAVVRADGLRALQKGLVPAMWYQLVMNGVRLGSYQSLVNAGFVHSKPKPGESKYGITSKFVVYFEAFFKITIHPSSTRFILTRLLPLNRSEVSLAKGVVAGAIAGVLGAVVASPFFLVKTHLQSKADAYVATVLDFLNHLMITWYPDQSQVFLFWRQSYKDGRFIRPTIFWTMDITMADFLYPPVFCQF
jgi:solute carrier family 25 protein 34/35